MRGMPFAEKQDRKMGKTNFHEREYFMCYRMAPTRIIPAASPVRPEDRSAQDEGAIWRNSSLSADSVGRLFRQALRDGDRVRTGRAESGAATAGVRRLVLMMRSTFGNF
jgi:hypothetical protein